jgi:anti-anti-sigma factor
MPRFPWPRPNGRFRESQDPDGVVRSTWRSELDLSVASRLSDQLRRLAREQPAARLDLSKIDFIDLPALRALIRAIEDGRHHGCEAVAAPEVRHAVARLVQVAGVGDRLWPADGRLRPIPTRTI